MRARLEVEVTRRVGSKGDAILAVVRTRPDSGMRKIRELQHAALELGLRDLHLLLRGGKPIPERTHDGLGRFHLFAGLHRTDLL